MNSVIMDDAVIGNEALGALTLVKVKWISQTRK